MQIAATASALRVTRQGASAAIPTRAEVEAFQSEKQTDAAETDYRYRPWH